ncbi:MAG: hypothetical protein FJ137_15870 [Deltaproteobacteria bacterium]|nr:hypothetical protein [Deltaproteobacteria bacterium]
MHTRAKMYAPVALALALAANTPASSDAPSAPPATTVSLAPGQGLKAVLGDDAFTFQVRGRIQARAEAENDGEAGSVGFAVRRLRLVLVGDMLQKQFSYYVQLGLAPRDVESETPNVTRDAWVAWNATPAFRLRIGQMKVPFDRQRVTSSSALQFPERSGVVNELTLDRDLGVVAFSTPLFDQLSYQLGLFGGDGRSRLNEDDGLLATARVQWTPLGRFDDDHVEGDVKRDERARLATAVAVGFNKASPRARSTIGALRFDDRVDYLHCTADVLFKRSGLSVLVQGLSRVATATQLEGARARSAVGAFAQVGLMVSEQSELVGRFGHVEPVALAVANESDLVRTEEVRVGVNHYWLGHDLKLSSDLGAKMPDGGPVEFDAHVMTQVFF